MSFVWFVVLVLYAIFAGTASIPPVAWLLLPMFLMLDIMMASLNRRVNLMEARFKIIMDTIIADEEAERKNRAKNA